jgi:GDPmannose 4,6-dehydratase
MTGQDGPYLARLLLEKGYKVYGLIKRYSNPNLDNLKWLGIENDIELITGDITDENCMNHLMKSIRPQEFYNLAAQSFVGVSWDLNKLTTEVNSMGPLNILNAIKTHSPNTRFYQASTSEMYGNSDGGQQNENTAFKPRSPYGVSKLYSHWMTINFRESYGIHACSGILFNHESPLRGREFVTRTVTDGVARIRTS